MTQLIHVMGCRLAGLTLARQPLTIPTSSLNHLEQKMDVQQTIRDQVTSHPVVLYMKGTPQFPQCGFSARALQILSACGVKNLFSINVLDHPAIRSGIKEFSNWPTIPQLYVSGEFVGGSDIMGEMFQSGELQKMLEGVATHG